VRAPQARAGPRLELFSMTAAAAVCGLGVALVPRLLITEELASGSLMLASDANAPPERAYYLISPEREADGMALQSLRTWLQTQAAAAPPGMQL
jgi:LysR family glycine cleavage system transcriptional activator